MFDVIIIGAGPAGLMAGITAAASGEKTLVLEHMTSAARKLLICGKGRCNITNACDMNEIINNIPRNGKFLYSAFRVFNNEKLINFFHENNLATKVERGGRVFPESDKAQDVKDVLLNVLAKHKGKLQLQSKVQKIEVRNNRATGIRIQDGSFIAGKKVILAAGGASYPQTGSDGSGFKLAAECGHTIVTPRPSLVPLESKSPYLSELQGLSLRNVEISIVVADKKVKKELGEMLFTHFGLSGPVILTLSNFVAEYLEEGKFVEISIDLKPALDTEKLDNRLKRDFEKYSKKQIKNSLFDLTPSSLIHVLLNEAGIDENKFTNQITKTERRALISKLKDLRFMVTKTRPLSEAIVTAGGVCTKEIDPKTMQSKIIDNLYFAGEVIDINGYTGGFNLQAAFSTGYLAGSSNVAKI